MLGLRLKCKVFIRPARNRETSNARKDWCRNNVGDPGKDWNCGWVNESEGPLDFYTFAREEDATMFSLRWM